MITEFTLVHPSSRNLSQFTNYITRVHQMAKFYNISQHNCCQA